MKDVYLGAAYYPELWDASVQEEDIARCKSLGINTLRVGEFAWGAIEPKEGEYDFSWLIRTVDKLYENGINTVMCTPTCTPPRWLLDKYEETRTVTQNGTRADVSSRCHTCKTSPVMRSKNAAIVERLAKIFSKHSGVIGWQIDNEIFPYGEGCFCNNCKSAFRGYLKDKYGSVENLNKKWGMSRWSLCYDGFEDIQPPHSDQWRHPSLRKAWWDFQCRQIKTFVEEQADILHRYGCKNVGTDMMQHNWLSYYEVLEKLDVVQFNHYNTAEELPETAFSYDFLRCVKDKAFWVTETQAGWNGSEFADSGFRPAGNCYVNTWLPLAKGAEMNLYWLFRAHPNGHELAHGALFSTAGRENKVSEEVKRVAADILKCGNVLTDSKIVSKIALTYSSTAANCFSSAPLIKNFDYRKTLIQNYYSALGHYNVDVIDTPHALDGYEVIISPFLAVADENGFKERVTEWIKNGGTWIVGPNSDVMDGDVSKYLNAPYSFLEELAGVYTKYQVPLDNGVFKAKWADGGECSVSLCFDAYELKDGTISLADYNAGELAPYSVIAERKVGKGKIILVGSVISRDDLLKLVDRAPIAEASPNIVLTERGGFLIAVETQHKNGYIVLSGEYTDLIKDKKLKGKTEIEPYEVLVLKKSKSTGNL